EPTAVLTSAEVTQLFAVLERLRHSGTAVLFITHKLAEVMAIADRITVMRHGRVVGRVTPAQVTAADLAVLMVGSFAAPAPPPPPADAPAQLEIRHLSATDDRGLTALNDVTVAVRAGEIFGVAGVDGNGQAELFEVLAGLRQPAGGTVAVGGTQFARFEPAA